MKGTFIVIDGIDGSGKGTQTKLLVERLQKEGLSVEVADFPQYGHWSAQFVERYLRGEFGTMTEVTAQQASLFYALDRYAASFQIRQWLQENKIIISNRYVSANKGHQLAKLPADQRRQFLSWLNQLEYSILNLPKPHVTIFLHMPAAIGQKLVDQKDARAYLHGKKRDLHEENLEHLQKAEQAYLFCVGNDTEEHWEIIECSSLNQPRAISDIHQEVYHCVKKIIK